jgi:predicted SAM-dependent methyltransferase
MSNRYGPLKLNLGCGEDYREGYINIDTRNLPRLDIKWRVDDLAEYVRDKSVEEILAFDVLEHFPIREVPGALDEWIRMLAPGGVLQIKTPDLDILAKTLHDYSGNVVDVRHMIDRVYGGQDYPQNFHRCGFNLALLKQILEVERGLKIIKVHRENCNIHIHARKGDDPCRS